MDAVSIFELHDTKVIIKNLKYPEVIGINGVNSTKLL